MESSGWQQQWKKISPRISLPRSRKNILMVKDAKTLEAFDREWLSRKTNNPEINWNIFEALYEEAKSLGIFPLKDPLDGLEHKIQLARIIHDFSISS